MPNDRHESGVNHGIVAACATKLLQSEPFVSAQAASAPGTSPVIRLQRFFSALCAPFDLRQADFVRRSHGLFNRGTLVIRVWFTGKRSAGTRWPGGTYIDAVTRADPWRFPCFRVSEY